MGGRQDKGWILAAPRLNGGRLFAGTTEGMMGEGGMGPRIEDREGTGGDGRLHEGRLFAGMTEEGVREGVIRMKDGFPPPSSRG